jgi:hypothetical protein
MLLVSDVENHLVRLDRLGQVIVRKPAPAPLGMAVCADEGNTVAAIGKRNQVWMMTTELTLTWERPLSRRPLAVALDAFGRQLAVADEGGGVHVFDTAGKVVWTATSARPLVHLAFVPEAPVLVGSAEFGLVCAFDRTGHCLWRDGLVAHVGALAVCGDGARIVLACFTEGLCGYALTQPRQVRLPKAAPSRLVALSYTGQTTLTADLDCQVALRDAEGEILDELPLPAAPAAIAVEALGESAVAVLSSGEIVRIEMPEEAAS